MVLDPQFSLLKHNNFPVPVSDTIMAMFTRHTPLTIHTVNFTPAIKYKLGFHWAPVVHSVMMNKFRDKLHSVHMDLTPLALHQSTIHIWLISNNSKMRMYKSLNTSACTLWTFHRKQGSNFSLFEKNCFDCKCLRFNFYWFEFCELASVKNW